MTAQSHNCLPFLIGNTKLTLSSERPKSWDTEIRTQEMLFTGSDYRYRDKWTFLIQWQGVDVEQESEQGTLFSPVAAPIFFHCSFQHSDIQKILIQRLHPYLLCSIPTNGHFHQELVQSQTSTVSTNLSNILWL